jgi:hypothetical protein
LGKAGAAIAGQGLKSDPTKVGSYGIEYAFRVAIDPAGQWDGNFNGVGLAKAEEPEGASGENFVSG